LTSNFWHTRVWGHLNCGAPLRPWTYLRGGEYKKLLLLASCDGDSVSASLISANRPNVNTCKNRFNGLWANKRLI